MTDLPARTLDSQYVPRHWILNKCLCREKVVPRHIRPSVHNSSSLLVPHDRFSIHEYINHLCRILFPGGRPTSLARSSFGKPLASH